MPKSISRSFLLAAVLATCAQAAPPGMVWVPAGQFSMGTDDANSMPNECPARTVWVDGFWMDETLVTNAQFAAFVKATQYVTTAERAVDWEELKKQVPPGTPKPPPEALAPGSLVYTPPKRAVDLRDLSNWWTWTPGASWRHPAGPGSDIAGRENEPVTQVSYDDAAAYATWAGKQLPTEAQWERAARGGTTSRFYWGDTLRPGGKYVANIYTGSFPIRDTAEDGFAGVSPVKSFPANGYGLFDMAGNVWQWTADLYRADLHAQKQSISCDVNPAGPPDAHDPSRPVQSSIERVIKGGSFLCNVSYCESYRPSARRGSPPDTATQHTGFRCVSVVK